MTSERPASTEPRVPLTRERVLRAALELADSEGIGAVTMRRLGQRLGVEAMSLYHHVADKDDLLNGLLDLVEAEIEIAPPDMAWKPGLRATAISAYQAMQRHSWATAVATASQRLRPGKRDLMEALLGGLRRAGFSAQLTDLGYHALDSHITGHTLWLASFQFSEEDLGDLAQQTLASLPRETFPYLVEHIEGHLDPNRESVDEFEFGLDLILDGLERRLRDTSR